LKALNGNKSELVVALIRRGANADVETEAGITAVIRATLNGVLKTTPSIVHDTSHLVTTRVDVQGIEAI
jgi:ankyrin repeat protein